MSKKTAKEFKLLPKVLFEKPEASSHYLKIGIYYKGEGIYVGTYKPVDIDGRSLCKVFNLFAAKQDLEILPDYYDVLKKVRSIQGLEGHNGADFGNHIDFYNALKDETYNGEWFIPTLDMLKANQRFKDLNQSVTMAGGTLYNLREKGALKGSFNIDFINGFSNKLWYWSCTEVRNNSSGVYNVDFTSGNSSWNYKCKDLTEFSARVVRAVPRILT